MDANTRTYTVGVLARMACVTVRTLHYYDEIDLLTPSSRSDAGYRLYTGADLLRLQQILLYRELDLPLEEIADVLDDPLFDPVEALTDHRRVLEQRIARTQQLLATIDKTIRRIKGDTVALTDEELYEGLSREQATRYRSEAESQYGPEMVAQTTQRIRKMGKEGWNRVKAEGDALTLAIAELMGHDPAHADVQAQIGHHVRWIENFYAVTPAIYRGLAQLYVTNDEFRDHYEKVAPGLADFLSQAMLIHAGTVLSK